ncbi:MAG: Rv0909 family putative TA system antitoxin [Ilumatobacter sp.]
MGLLNARNLRKAKQLLEKNRHKIGDAVEKAGTQLDKVSKGKTTAATAKASDAAKKYSAGGVTHHGIDTPAESPVNSTYSAEEAQARQAAATVGAANAVKGAADALTNLVNKAASKAEATNAAKGGGASADAAGEPDDGITRDEFDRG